MPSIDLVARAAAQILNVSVDSSLDLDGAGCQGVTVNPDISGIGVRLSFYLQNLFLGKFDTLY